MSTRVNRYFCSHCGHEELFLPEQPEFCISCGSTNFQEKAHPKQEWVNLHAFAKLRSSYDQRNFDGMEQATRKIYNTLCNYFYIPHVRTLAIFDLLEYSPEYIREAGFPYGESAFGSIIHINVLVGMDFEFFTSTIVHEFTHYFIR